MPHSISTLYYRQTQIEAHSRTTHCLLLTTSSLRLSGHVSFQPSGNSCDLGGEPRAGLKSDGRSLFSTSASSSDCIFSLGRAADTLNSFSTCSLLSFDLAVRAKRVREEDFD